MSGDKLKLSDSKGIDPKGSSALEPITEGPNVKAQVLADLKGRRKELQKKAVDLLKESVAKEKHEPEKKSAPSNKAAPGKSRHVAHAEGWKAICTAPDLCRVGKDIVGFDSMATLDNKQKSSSDVKARGTSVYRKGDIFKTVQGDAGKHIESGTSLGNGYVQILDGHDSVKVNNIPVARHDSRCKINCDASGKGGTMGKLITEQKTVGPGNASAASNPQAPPGERTSTKLEMLKKAKEQIESGQLDLDALDEYVDFKDGNVVLDEVIGSIRGTPGSHGDYPAQAARGLLGFVKDIVMGVSELAYEGVKAVPKLVRRTGTESGILQTLIDAQIFAEEIALGNFDGQGFGKAALELGRAVLKPVTDPWAKGQYVEASVRAIAEIGTVGAGSIKGGQALKAASAEMASKTAQAGDAIKMADVKIAPDSKRNSGGQVENFDDGVHVSKIGGENDGANYRRNFRTYTGDELDENFVGPLSQNSYADRIVGNVTAPIDFEGHIFSAEVKANGTVVGGHATVTGQVQVIPGSASAPNAQGVYSAKIRVADPANPGQFLPKTNNGGVSTLFPDSWSANRIKVEVDAAFQNRNIVGNKWTGTTPSGVRVEGYLNPRTTVYPKL